MSQRTDIEMLRCNDRITLDRFVICLHLSVLSQIQPPDQNILYYENEKFCNLYFTKICECFC